MLRIEDLSFSLAGRPLFAGASAHVPAGARVGLVGRNGAGKTTLFHMIEGAHQPDGGAVTVRQGARIGGVRQEAPAGPAPLIDIVLAADAERAALIAEAETAADPARIAEIQTRLTDIDAHSAEARVASILSGLGFDAAAQARPAAEFSGGWRMRVALAAVLFSRPDLLLLDEPTNYLDLEGALWLETFLARYPATAIVISHDRGLLNRAVDRILHLRAKELTLYAGGYDDFDAARRAKLAQTEAQAKKQAAERAHIQKFVDRFRYKASKAKQAQSRLKALARMAPIVGVAEGRVAPFAFRSGAPLSPPILSFDTVSAGYDGAPVLSGISQRIDPDDRIALLGPNGEGKSTLAKLISGRLAPMAGELTRAPKLRVGYFAQHQLDELTAHETPVQHLRRLIPDLPEAKLRARLGAVGIGAEIATSRAETLSGGQKARLLLALMTAHEPHLLILDEPTNHLDIESREALAQALADYEGAVILITHDSDLVEACADRLWLIQGGRVAPFDGDMSDYRDLILGPRAAERRARKSEGGVKQKSRRDGAEARRAAAPLRADLAACEARLAKLEEMRAAVDRLLADPDLYDKEGPKKIEALQKKRAEIEAGVARAEALWLKAGERLEAAEG